MKLYTSFLCALLFSLTSYSQSFFPAYDEYDIIKVFDDSSGYKFIDEAFLKKEKKAFDKAAKSHEKKFQSAAHDGNKKQLASEAANLGFVSLKKNDVSNTLQYFEQALNSFRATGNARGEMLMQAFTGYFYLQQKSDKIALDYLLPAYGKAQSMNATRKAALLASMSGEAYNDMKDDADAIVYFTEATRAYRKLNDKKQAATNQNAVAESFIKNDEVDKAITQLQEASALFEDIKDADGAAVALRNIGIAFFKNDQYENALDYLNRSVKKSNELQVKKIIPDVYLKLASVNAASKNKAKQDLYDGLYKSLKDSIDKTESSRTLTGRERFQEQEEKNLIRDLLNNEKRIQSQKLTQKELEYNKKITEGQLERLKKEQTIVQLNDSLRVTKGDKLEREMEIQKLTTERTQQELALSQQQVQLKEKELSLNTQRNIRNLAIVAAVFISIFLFLMYYRYREKKLLIDSLNRALDDLKATQAQLIQSEKMASLGQLTAGIAHEIQNPLNFVNNFSELSVDLLREMETTKDASERKDMIDDLKVNLEKINHHGKRADSIVKSMLLHSRSEHGEMQKVNINRLCEDAIKLAWHGMRSVRSDFQCVMEKNFDESLPEIVIIPQDINRVLLNLFNNAFYAVYKKGEAAKGGEEKWEPVVTITTSIKDHHISIVIEDNGTGIPDEIKEKIFNPFFTTKPTGQGTGLGLSLSYDIIQAHHGELKMESEEGIGTEFTVTLPAGR